ncbi:hypothetical protein KAU19_06215 [Candidatus Parcubacteria bacterium]|nr:hypothetical protein [Candidatus Parcubacteria bacterium]
MISVEKKAKENAKVNKRPLSSALLDHYQLPPSEKQKFLDKSEHIELFNAIPVWVADSLKDAFLHGRRLVEIPDGQAVIDYFQKHSTIIPALTKDPGTFTMLEKMYFFEKVYFPIDVYFAKGVASGQSLSSRYYAVNERSAEFIGEIIEQNGFCLMIDIGSGPGRNGMDICLMHSEFAGKIQIDCIDTDQSAINKGYELLKSEQYRNLTNIRFINKSIMKLNGRYHKNVDFGLLIGILCGLTFRERVALLWKLKSFFNRGAKLLVAGLTDEMLRADLFCSYILYETTGWILQYSPLGEVHKAIEKAGWKWGGYFQESTGLYEIGVAIAP